MSVGASGRQGRRDSPKTHLLCLSQLKRPSRRLIGARPLGPRRRGATRHARVDEMNPGGKKQPAVLARAPPPNVKQENNLRSPAHQVHKKITEK